jgi:hypothetical protein
MYYISRGIVGGDENHANGEGKNFAAMDDEHETQQSDTVEL